MTDRACLKCGLPRDQWRDDAHGGFAFEGEVYCCRGCAEGPGCTCLEYRPARGEGAPTQEEIRKDRASGDFVQSLQKERKTVGPEDYGTEAITKAPTRDVGPA